MITQEYRRRITIFSCIGVGHTTTNRPLLAETTVLPLSSIALWCRVALSDCPIHFHSSFLKEIKTTSFNYALRTVYLLLLLLRLIRLGHMSDQHSLQKKQRGGKMLQFDGGSLMWPGATAKCTTANLVSNVQSWILNVNYYTPVKNTTTITSNYSNNGLLVQSLKWKGMMLGKTVDGNLHAEKGKWKCSCWCYILHGNLAQAETIMDGLWS